MALEVFQYLINKFLFNLEEAEEDGAELPLQSLFSKIREFLIENDTSCLPMADGTKNLLYDLNSALMECQVIRDERLRVQKGQFSPNAIRQHFLIYQQKNKLLQVIEKLENLHKDQHGDASTYVTHSRPSSIYIGHTTHTIHGFEDQIENIKSRLLQPHDGRRGMAGIGIVGIGGCGKTALAFKVFNSPEVREHFPVMIWASLAKTMGEEECTRKNIFMDVLKGVQGYATFERKLKRLKEEPDNSLLDTLIPQFWRFLNGKKYIIVLDDVWDTSTWYGDGFPSDLIGKQPYIFSHELFCKTRGTIIVTSRQPEVARRVVGAANLHHVQPISDEACWTIFTDAVERTKIISPDDIILARIKNEIVDNCAGLPLAAHTLAKIIPEQIKVKSEQHVESSL